MKRIVLASGATPMTCGYCGHTRAAHTYAMRCHHVACECSRFVSSEEAHRHCYQDIHNCAWLTVEEQAMPRRESR